MLSKDVEALAKRLMVEHGLGHWSFIWISSARVFGRCHYGRREIQMSRELCQANNLFHVNDTILHEIAHALAGLKAKHGPLWVSVAKRIGCTGERCFSFADVNMPITGGYSGTCLCRNFTHIRSTKPHSNSVHRCKKCNQIVTFKKQ